MHHGSAKMSTTQRQLRYGPVDIYIEKTLGVGSYGKVCEARCGQLPCAAKLLHDTFFQSNDPGTHNLERKFEEECRFLSHIRHPNIIQYLTTVVEERSRKPVLLMERMKESLTAFLQRYGPASSPIPYHLQISMCYDIALALSFLHSNDIIHRDLSSNNILLTAGNRAKITDFGIAKLTDAYPKMTPLTKVPGTVVYMPPEALTTPPLYSHKLDCFSYGVIVIQIATRHFPEPGEGTRFVSDPNYPTGRAIMVIPEVERRRRHIDTVESTHPLLPLALQCLKDWDRDRPSADGICETLSSLRNDPLYKEPVRAGNSGHPLPATYASAAVEKRLQLSIEWTESLQRDLKHSQERESEMRKCLDSLRREYDEQERRASERLMQQAASLREQLRNKQRELEESLAREDHMHRSLLDLQQRNRTLKERLLEQERTLQAFQMRHLELEKQNQRKTREKKSSAKTNRPPAAAAAAADAEFRWRHGQAVPDRITSYIGQATIQDDTAYFSGEYFVYAYQWSRDTWETLPRCEHKCFATAIINKKPTAIGGYNKGNTHTNVILSFSRDQEGWEELLPPMQEARVHPAVVTTPTHLVVAGGMYEGIDKAKEAHASVELMTLDSLTWSMVSGLPAPVAHPQIASSMGRLVLTDTETSQVYSCAMEQLILSRHHGGEYVEGVWERKADIPVKYTSLVSLGGGHVLAVGGEQAGQVPIRAIYCYNMAGDKWQVVKEMPTARSWSLSVGCPGDVLVVVGGFTGKWEASDVTEIAKVKLP